MRIVLSGSCGGAEKLVPNFDPITPQVLWSRLVAAADEMALTLESTAFSHVVRDNHDYACALYAADGEMIAQAQASAPGQLGSMPRLLRQFLDAFPAETLVPGDVIATNDPWVGSGHTPDFYVASPVFLDGTLVGYAGCSAHHIDIGGRLAAPDAREVYEEGIIIPISKLYASGRPNEDIFGILRRNVRMADKVVGDLRAQVAANHVGAARVQEIMRARHLRSLDAVSQDVLALTEQRTRRAIASVPDGTYHSEFLLEDVNTRGQPLAIRVEICVREDEMAIDYRGTSPQVDLPINCVENFTLAHTMFAVKCALGLDLPFNSGCFAPVRISAPEGSLLNARFPAACMWRTDVAQCLPEVVFGALAAALPDNVMAPSGTYPLWLIILAGDLDSGEPFVAHFNASGGQGAMAGRDGHSTTVFPGTISNTPVEMMETEAPVVIERKSLRTDSAGSGTYRGGFGQEVIIRSLARDPMTVTVVGGRYRKGPEGYAGGASGAPGEIRVNDQAPFQRAQQIRLENGDRLLLRYPGGGGYGDPNNRDPERIARDRGEGLVCGEGSSSACGARNGNGLPVASTAVA